MRHLHTLQPVLSLFSLSHGHFYDSSDLMPKFSMSMNNSLPVLGHGDNYWKGNDDFSAWDLTRRERLPITIPRTVQMLGKRKQAIVEPTRTALMLVDMQNFFLHPKLKPHATRGRDAVPRALDMIYAFRRLGMKVLWVNWGIDEEDLPALPPPLLDNFSTDHTMASSFCTEMGLLDNNGTDVDMGRKLCRSSWNAQPWGPLGPALREGMQLGSDTLFHKNRLSGLAGNQTALKSFLQQSGLTTIFIGGVNSDQCVWNTILDLYALGLDIVYLRDCAATTNPWFAEEMVRYNANPTGFQTDSENVLAALE